MWVCYTAGVSALVFVLINKFTIYFIFSNIDNNSVINNLMGNDMTDTNTSAQSASDQLAAAQKAQAELNAKIEALLTQTREEDLATVKRLITTHSFSATDLRSVMKAKSSRTAPRKSTSRRRKI